MSTDAQITRIHVLEQLLQTTREAFWFIDSDTLTLDVNSAMCDPLGRAREDIIGRPI
jgi:PAS domain S-box-containing protein